MCSPSQNLLETSIFYYIFSIFYSGWGVLYFKQIPTFLWFSEKSIFLHKWLYIPLLLWEKIGTVHRKRFTEHPLFTTFSLFLKVSDICNISSKCWLLNKSANKIFLHKTPYNPLLIQKKLSSKLLKLRNYLNHLLCLITINNFLSKIIWFFPICKHLVFRTYRFPKVQISIH